MKKNIAFNNRADYSAGAYAQIETPVKWSYAAKKIK